MPKSLSHITRMCLLTACILTAIVFFTPVMAYAASNTHSPAVLLTAPANTQIDTAPFWHWYCFVRDSLMIPFVILRFAICGYSILMVTFTATGIAADRLLTDIKRKILESILIVFAIFILPGAMKAVKDLVKNIGWDPSHPALTVFFQGGIRL